MEQGKLAAAARQNVSTKSSSVVRLSERAQSEAILAKGVPQHDPGGRATDDASTFPLPSCVANFDHKQKMNE